MSEQQTEEQNVVMPMATLQKMMTVLGRLPYQDVAEVIGEVQQSARAVPAQVEPNREQKEGGANVS